MKTGALLKRHKEPTVRKARGRYHSVETMHARKVTEPKTPEHAPSRLPRHTTMSDTKLATDNKRRTSLSPTRKRTDVSRLTSGLQLTYTGVHRMNPAEQRRSVDRLSRYNPDRLPPDSARTVSSVRQRWGLTLSYQWAAGGSRLDGFVF